MRAYSKDLREKIVQAVDRKQGSQPQVAATFGVSVSFVEQLLRRRRTTGSVAPAPHGGGHPRRCDAAAQAWLRQRLQEQPDATLQELVEGLAAERGVRVGLSTLCSELQRLGLPRKKRASAPPNKRHRVSKRREQTIANSSRISRRSGSSSWTRPGSTGP